MDIKNLINPEIFLLVPVMWILGLFIKKSEINSKKIPLIILIISIILSLLYVLTPTFPNSSQMWYNTTINGIGQGILIAGLTVFGNELGKSIIFGGKNE